MGFDGAHAVAVVHEGGDEGWWVCEELDCAGEDEACGCERKEEGEVEK